MRPIRIAFARRPKSRGPDARRWRQGSGAPAANRPAGNHRFRLRSAGQLNPDGDEQSVSIAAGESAKQAEKTIACGTPDDPVLSW